MAEQTVLPNVAAAIAKAKKFEQDAARLKEETKTTILTMIDGHINELAELGLTYEGGIVEKNGGSRGEKTCTVCKKTGHNARWHQTEEAKAEAKS